MTRRFDHTVSRPGSIRVTRRRRLWWAYENREAELLGAVRGNPIARDRVLEWAIWTWLAVGIPIIVLILTVIMLFGR